MSSHLVVESALARLQLSSNLLAGKALSAEGRLQDFLLGLLKRLGIRNATLRDDLPQRVGSGSD